MNEQVRTHGPCAATNSAEQQGKGAALPALHCASVRCRLPQNGASSPERSLEQTVLSQTLSSQRQSHIDKTGARRRPGLYEVHAAKNCARQPCPGGRLVHTCMSCPSSNPRVSAGLPSFGWRSRRERICPPHALKPCQAAHATLRFQKEPSCRWRKSGISAPGGTQGICLESDGECGG